MADVVPFDLVVPTVPLPLALVPLTPGPVDVLSPSTHAAVVEHDVAAVEPFVASARDDEPARDEAATAETKTLPIIAANLICTINLFFLTSGHCGHQQASGKG